MLLELIKFWIGKSCAQGIGIVGTFNADEPNSLALQAVQDLIQCGVDRGTIKKGYSLLGHKDVASTDCPGTALYNVIKTWPNFGGTTSGGNKQVVNKFHSQLLKIRLSNYNNKSSMGSKSTIRNYW